MEDLWPTAGMLIFSIHLCVTSASGDDAETVGEFTFEEPAWIKLWILLKADDFLGFTQAKWNDTFVLFFSGTWLFYVFVNRAIWKLLPLFYFDPQDGSDHVTWGVQSLNQEECSISE